MKNTTTSCVPVSKFAVAEAEQKLALMLLDLGLPEDFEADWAITRPSSFVVYSPEMAERLEATPDRGRRYGAVAHVPYSGDVLVHLKNLAF